MLTIGIVADIVFISIKKYFESFLRLLSRDSFTFPPSRERSIRGRNSYLSIADAPNSAASNVLLLINLRPVILQPSRHFRLYSRTRHGLARFDDRLPRQNRGLGYLMWICTDTGSWHCLLSIVLSSGFQCSFILSNFAGNEHGGAVFSTLDAWVSKNLDSQPHKDDSRTSRTDNPAF